MLTHLTADWIFPVDSPPIKNGVIGINNDGIIQEILTAAQAEHLVEIEHYDGVVVPGLINTHCHLELSHMRGKLEEGTGLPNFIKGILSQRQQPEEEILTAMKNADQEMFENGIVAVGDISNLIGSKLAKLASKIYYHTFIEVFGFNRPSPPIIQLGNQLKAAYAPLKASVVPHAPYSVSKTLFDEIRKYTSEADILTIHNQETKGENQLFENGTGAFADFMADLGIAQSEAHNSGENAIHYHLPQMPKDVNTLLVHNTMSTVEDLHFAKNTHQNLYWCLCPNANLYIENALPNVELFKKEGVKITLGTDSLASNHQLNIISEMLTLQDRKGISFGESLKWATLNGAEFLKIDAQYGSLTVGKKPGIILLGLGEDQKLSTQTTIKRLY